MDQTDLKVILNGVLLRDIIDCIDCTKHFDLIFFCFFFYFVLVDDQYKSICLYFACRNFFLIHMLCSLGNPGRSQLHKEFVCDVQQGIIFNKKLVRRTME